MTSCNFSNKKEKIPTNNKNTDIFYTKSVGLDIVRFPLIKPFDITSIDIKESWLLGIGSDTDIYADNISELTILKSYIFVHSIGRTIVGDNFVLEGWYIVDTKAKEFLKGFATEKEFSKYLKSIQIDDDKLVWRKPAYLYKQFKETGCLPWIPNCK